MEPAALAGGGRGRCLSRSASKDHSGSSKGRSNVGGGLGGGAKSWVCEEAAWLRMEAGGAMGSDEGQAGPNTEQAPLLERRLTSNELELPAVRP